MATNAMAPSIDEVRTLADYLAGSRQVLANAVFSNNAKAAKVALGYPESAHVTVRQMLDLWGACDRDQQDEILAAVPYVQGQDQHLDAAIALMMERMREAGGEGLDELNHGPHKFIGLAIAAISSIVGAYGQIQAGKAAEEGEAAAARAQYMAQQAAAEKAKAEAEARKQKLKKLTPWIIGAAIVIVVILYRKLK